MSEEVLTLDCPLCTNPHRYTLAVERSVVLGFMYGDPQRHDVPFQRLFVCPVTSQKYQANFMLTETADSRIRSVSVGSGKKDGDG